MADNEKEVKLKISAEKTAEFDANVDAAVGKVIEGDEKISKSKGKQKDDAKSLAAELLAEQDKLNKDLAELDSAMYNVRRKNAKESMDAITSEYKQCYEKEKSAISEIESFEKAIYGARQQNAKEAYSNMLSEAESFAAKEKAATASGGASGTASSMQQEIAAFEAAQNQIKQEAKNTTAALEKEQQVRDAAVLSASKAVANTQKELDKEVANTAKTLAAEQQKLAKDTETAKINAAKAAAEAEKQANRDAAQGAKDAANQITDAFGALKSTLSTLGIAATLAAVVRGLKDIAIQTVETASSFEQMQMRLEALSHSALVAQSQMAMAVQASTTLPFDVGQVTEAIVNLEKFRASAEQMLPVAADLAAVFGKSLPDTAQALGKAWEGSQAGIRQLRNEFGFTNQQLKEHGAEVDKAGRIYTGTNEALGKYREALLAMASEYEGGAGKQMKTLSGELSNMRDQWTLVSKSIGEAFLPGVKLAVEELTKLASLINELNKGGFSFKTLGLGGNEAPAASGKSEMEAYVAEAEKSKAYWESQGMDENTSGKYDISKVLEYKKTLAELDKLQNDAQASAKKYGDIIKEVGKDTGAMNALDVLSKHGITSTEDMDVAITDMTAKLKAAGDQGDIAGVHMWGSAIRELKNLRGMITAFSGEMDELTNHLKDVDAAYALLKTSGGQANVAGEKSEVAAALINLEAKAPKMGIPDTSIEYGVKYRAEHPGSNDINKFFADKADMVGRLKKLDEMQEKQDNDAANKRVNSIKDEADMVAAKGGETLQLKLQYQEQELNAAEGNAKLKRQLELQVASTEHAIQLEQAKNQKEEIEEREKGFRAGLESQKRYNKELLDSGKISAQEYADSFAAIEKANADHVAASKNQLNRQGTYGQNLERGNETFGSEAALQHAEANKKAMEERTAEGIKLTEDAVNAAKAQYSTGSLAYIAELDKQMAAFKSHMAEKKTDEKKDAEEFIKLQHEKATAQREIQAVHEQNQISIANSTKRLEQESINRMSSDLKAGVGDPAKLAAAVQAQLAAELASIEEVKNKEIQKTGLVDDANQKAAIARQAAMQHEADMLDGILKKDAGRVSLAEKLLQIEKSFDSKRMGGSTSPFQTMEEINQKREAGWFGGEGGLSKFSLDRFDSAKEQQDTGPLADLSKSIKAGFEPPVSDFAKAVDKFVAASGGPSATAGPVFGAQTGASLAGALSGTMGGGNPFYSVTGGKVNQPSHGPNTGGFDHGVDVQSGRVGFNSGGFMSETAGLAAIQGGNVSNTNSGNTYHNTVHVQNGQVPGDPVGGQMLASAIDRIMPGADLNNMNYVS